MKRILFFLAFGVLASCNSFTPFTFVHLSDTQIGFIDKSPQFAHSDSLMKAAVLAVNELDPLLVVNTGDHVNVYDDPVQDSIFRVRSAEIKAPLYMVPGNHDITTPYYLENRGRYVKARGYDRFSVKKKGCAFIGIDSNCIINKTPDAAMTEEEQFSWLTKELHDARKCKHIFIFLHCPIFRVRVDEPVDYSNFPVEKREKYLRLFKDAGVTAIFAGHLHRTLYSEYEGMKMFVVGPVANALGNGTPGFNLVSVTKDGVEVEYVPTPGIDPTHCRF